MKHDTLRAHLKKKNQFFRYTLLLRLTKHMMISNLNVHCIYWFEVHICHTSYMLILLLSSSLFIILKFSEI